MSDKYNLAYYIAELRRVEQSRQANSMKEIGRLCNKLLKDLNGYLANTYTEHSDSDGKLTVAMLQEKSQYAKFLEEVEQRVDNLTPKVAANIQTTVKKTYKAVYDGMVEATNKCTTSEAVKECLQGLNVRPEIMKRAIENPISGLTLPDRLEKNRRNVIYDIKQVINIGLMNGDRYDTMSKNVRKVLVGDDKRGGYYGKAANIVRTETHRVTEGGLMDCAKDIDTAIQDTGFVYTATWRNMGDSKVRPNVRIYTSKGWKTKTANTNANHIKMEGQIIQVGDLFDLGNGVKAEHPGGSGDAANDCNCRCFVEYEMMKVADFLAKGGKLLKSKDFTNDNESSTIKSQEKEKIENLNMLKQSGMTDAEYNEYLEIINNHQNPDITQIYKSHADEITKIKRSSKGAYQQASNSITFSYPVYDDMNKYSTLAHEYGHFFDAKVNYKGLHFKEIQAVRNATGLNLFQDVASSSDEFLEAVRKDKVYIKSIFTADAKKDMLAHNASAGVQDAIDGLFSKSRIRWGHGESYYNRNYASVDKMDKITSDNTRKKKLQQVYKDLGLDASNQAKTKVICRQYEAASEMWANIMSAEVCGGEELEYIKKYLPNSYEALINILKGAE